MKFKYLCLLFIALLTYLLVSCGTREITGSGDIITENRALSPFSEIKVKGAFHVAIRMGKNQEVTVQSNKELLPYIKTTVADHALVIESDAHVSLHPRGKQQIIIVIPTIEKIELSGANTVEVTGIHGDHLELVQSGSNESTLQGSVKMLQILASGQTTVDAQKLIAVDANVEANGSSEIKVHAQNHLDIKMNGSGLITYIGNPKEITQQIHGEGIVSNNMVKDAS